MLSAVSVAEAVDSYLRLSMRTKWPNDLFLSGGKCCGILCEAEVVGDRYAFAVIGIGINVHHEPAALPEGAAALSEYTKKKIDTSTLLTKVLAALEKRLDQLEAGEREDVRARWTERCAHIGEQLRINSPHGVVDGICEGIDEDGALLLRTGAGTLEKILSGTVLQ